ATQLGAARIGPRPEQLVPSTDGPGQRALRRRILDLGCLGRALRRREPVEYDHFVLPHVVAVVVPLAAPRDALAGTGDCDLARLRVLDRERALDDVVEAVLVVERLPRLGRAKPVPGPEQVDE